MAPVEHQQASGSNALQDVMAAVEMAFDSNVKMMSQNTSMMNQSDPFESSAGPIMYMSENRMPVMIEFNTAIIYVIFAALIMALLFILPGVRRTKLTSLLGLITLLTVGATILLALDGTRWLTGTMQLQEATYGSLTGDTVTGRLEVHIGLTSANVTLTGRLSPIATDEDDANEFNKSTKFVDYNERFYWRSPDNMAREHIAALRRGLPYPILTVTEFLSHDADGFSWTRNLRQAGYYCTMSLYAALASWSLTLAVMCMIPVYLPYMMQMTGVLMVFSASIYTALIQTPQDLTLQINGVSMEFALGYTYVSTIVVGGLSVFAGLLLLAYQFNRPHEQFTIMDSENFVQDQKALHGHALRNMQLAHNSLVAASSKQRAVADVVIPIGDIEAKFGAPNRST